jgi:hypothetical protein
MVCCVVFHIMLHNLGMDNEKVLYCAILSVLCLNESLALNCVLTSITVT